ncbi:MAG: 8-amino-7-oxononanoate synthase [Phycisphaeraceae bacterium]|nr:8-amino-7-oxononanoate synthase [Phycisphaeraceae bacterium]
MDPWVSKLRAELEDLQRGSLLRRLKVVEAAGPKARVGGRWLWNLSSNDYLGLADHPRLKEAAIAAIAHFGTGARASRLVSGHLPIHEQVEKQFAAFKGMPAALLCPTGYMANLAVLTSLAGPGDWVIVDKLNHASLLDAAAASGAKVRVFPHLQLGKLRRLLERRAAENNSPLTDVRGSLRRSLPEVGEIPGSRSVTARGGRVVVVVDSVFSMDGDVSDLPAICDLAEEFGALVVVDEAHGTGVLGTNGRGLCEVQGVSGRVDVVVSTASKALGGLGGVITARQEVIDWIVNRGRSFIYTTAMPAGQAAAIGAALAVVADEPWRRRRVEELSRGLRSELGQRGWLGAGDADPAVVTPIVPLTVGPAETALALAAHLEEAGFLAPAIRPPTVPANAARVRLSLRADLEDQAMTQLLACLDRFPGRLISE